MLVNIEATKVNKGQQKSTFSQQKFNIWSTKIQRWINKNSAKSQKMLAELQKNGNLDGRNGKKVKFGWSKWGKGVKFGGRNRKKG